MDFFDRFAPLYDVFFHPNLKGQCDDDLLSRSGFMVDLGGGTGKISSDFHTKERVNVVVDLSIPMLEQAKQREQLNPVCADGAALPFSSETISSMIIADAFHHFQDRERIMIEVKRILKKDGAILLFEPNIKDWRVKVIAFAERILGMNSKFYPIEDIEKVLIEWGFKIEKRKEDRTTYCLFLKK